MRVRPVAALLLSAPWLLSLGCAPPAITEFDCSPEGRKAFVGQIMTDYYLWSDRIPADIDYAAFETPEALMRELTFKELDHWSGMQQRAERQEFYDQGRFQ